MPEFSHFDHQGQARMVDVGSKAVTTRQAIAQGRIRMQPATLAAILDETMTKGDVFGVARIAGIMAAKRTSGLIPLCHPLAITAIDVRFTPFPDDGVVEIAATVKIDGKTGVEMEALTAVSVAALTVYDMCKAVDRGMRIEQIRLIKKSGGKSGTFDASERE